MDDFDSDAAAEAAYRDWKEDSRNQEIDKLKENLRVVIEALEKIHYISSGSNYAGFDSAKGWEIVYNTVSEVLIKSEGDKEIV